MDNENLQIIAYQPVYAKKFYDLNVAWLKKYFYVEPYDEKVLSNPQKYVIDPGGFIFLAKYNNEIVGVVALINQKTFFELSKMAVSPKYQGLKISLKKLSSEDDKTIVLITHKLKEIQEFTESIFVLKDGVMVAKDLKTQKSIAKEQILKCS